MMSLRRSRPPLPAPPARRAGAHVTACGTLPIFDHDVGATPARARRALMHERRPSSPEVWIILAIMLAAWAMLIALFA